MFPDYTDKGKERSTQDQVMRANNAGMLMRESRNIIKRKGRDFANELSECITDNNYAQSLRLTCIGCRNPSMNLNLKP